MKYNATLAPTVFFLKGQHIPTICDLQKEQEWMFENGMMDMGPPGSCNLNSGHAEQPIRDTYFQTNRHFRTHSFFLLSTNASK